MSGPVSPQVGDRLSQLQALVAKGEKKGLFTDKVPGRILTMVSHWRVLCRDEQQLRELLHDWILGGNRGCKKFQAFFLLSFWCSAWCLWMYIGGGMESHSCLANFFLQVAIHVAFLASSLSLSLSHTLFLSVSLSLSVSLTHSLYLSLSLSLSLSPSSSGTRGQFAVHAESRRFLPRVF